jgi:hypothetical protein
VSSGMLSKQQQRMLDGILRRVEQSLQLSAQLRDTPLSDARWNECRRQCLEIVRCCQLYRQKFDTDFQNPEIPFADWKN